MKRIYFLCIVVVCFFVSNPIVEVFAKGRPQSIVFHDFESTNIFETWMMIPTNSPGAALSYSTKQKHGGKASAKLDYNFSKDNELGLAGFLPKDYNVGLPVKGEPTYLGVWVYGDGSNYNIQLSLLDANREIEGYIKKIDWVGWKYVEFEIAKVQAHYSGDNNGIVNFPVSLLQIMCTKDIGVLGGKGAIYLDDICFTTDSLISNSNSEEYELNKSYTLSELKQPSETNFARKSQANNNSEISPTSFTNEEKGLCGVVVDNSEMLNNGPNQKAAAQSIYYAHDGNTDTIYTSSEYDAPEKEEWIQVDIPQIQKIDSVILVPAANGEGFPVDFKIKTSSDGVNWNEAITKEGYVLDGVTPQKFSIPLTECQHVRLSASKLSKSGQKYSLRLAELQIYNYFDINFALYTNGGIVTGSNPMIANTPAGYCEFYNNIFDLHANYFYIKSKSAKITDDFKKNLANLASNNVDVIYGLSEIHTEDLNSYVRELKGLVDIWCIDNVKTSTEARELYANIKDADKDASIGIELTALDTELLKEIIQQISVDMVIVRLSNKSADLNAEIINTYQSLLKGAQSHASLCVIEDTEAIGLSNKSIAKYIAKMQTYYASHQIPVLWNGPAIYDGKLRLFDENWKTNELWNNVRNAVSVFGKDYKQDTSVAAEFTGGGEHLTNQILKNVNGDIAIVIWNNIAQQDSNIGTGFDLMVKDVSIENAFAEDALTGTQHSLNYETKNGAVFIRDLVARDYPIVILLKANNQVIAGMTPLMLHKVGISTVVSLHSNKAYIGGVKTLIDAKNPNVKPYMTDGVLWVPLRFLAESFGATVTYNQVSYTITIKKDNTQVKILLGGKTALINDKLVYIDTPLVEKEGRVFISLKMLTSLFNRYVYTDDSGIVIISNQKYFIDKTADAQLLKQLIALFDNEQLGGIE